MVRVVVVVVVVVVWYHPVTGAEAPEDTGVPALVDERPKARTQGALLHKMQQFPVHHISGMCLDSHGPDRGTRLKAESGHSAVWQAVPRPS